MFRVLECIVGQHDLRLVLLAALVWVLGSASLFLLLQRSLDCVETRRRQWVVFAALAAGVGVWATHFIAMLAYDGPMPLAFDPALTALSVAIVVLGFWLSLLVTGRDFRIGSCVVAGVIAAGGVTAMHFTGMAAIVVPAVVRYDLGAIVVAFAILAGCFALAFAGFGRFEGQLRIAVPASLAVVGVVALHYTAMSATVLAPDPARGLVGADGGHQWLIVAIVAATLGLIGALLGGAFLDRMLTDMRGFTDATLEGLAILNRGRIVDARSRYGARGRAAARFP